MRHEPTNDSICRDCGEQMSEDEATSWGQCGLCHVGGIHAEHGHKTFAQTYKTGGCSGKRTMRVESSDIQYHGDRFNQGEW